jgi:hypothetical protein
MGGSLFAARARRGQLDGFTVDDHLPRLRPIYGCLRVLKAGKSSFDLCAMCFVRGKEMDGIRKTPFRSLHRVTGYLQHSECFKLGADYLIDALDLVPHFVELLVSEANLVFLFDEQPKHHVSPFAFRAVLEFAAKPPDVLLSDIFTLVHESTCRPLATSVPLP